MSNPLHRVALDSEPLFFIGEVWVCSNPVFGILFKDKYDDYVFNRFLCLEGGI